MGVPKPFVRSLLLILLAVVVLTLTTPSQTAEEENERLLRILSPSLLAADRPLFDPILPAGTLNPLEDQYLRRLAAYLLVNARSGEVYTTKNATERLAPASLTKLVTAMVALDVSKPQTRLIASLRSASQEPTILGVQVGEAFRLSELIPALIATSANDAATIIGEEVVRPYGGNEAVFIALMNKKVQALGLRDTQFTNTQGYDDPLQYTTASDLVRLAHYAIDNYPLIRQAAATLYATIEKTPEHGFYHLPNWNALLGTYPGVNGLKIGYTQNAKHVTIVTAERDSLSVIAVVLGAESIIERDLAAATLLNYAFQKEGLDAVKVEEPLIKPRLDEWRMLREQILKEMGNEAL